MSRLRAALRPVRLARPMARRPLAFLASGLLICILGGLGLLRYGVESGTELLVGKGSDVRQVNDRFTGTYGSDPIVVVIHADPDHPASFYLENNILRLVRLEGDIQSDPNVQSVLGPGSAITSAQEAVGAEISNTEAGFQQFVTESALLSILRQKGQTSPGVFDLSKLTQDDLNTANKTGQQDLQLLELTIAKATQQAEDARAAYDASHPPDSNRILDAREQAADQAAQKVAIPPLLAEYVAGGINLPDNQRKAADDRAHLVISQFAAAFGQCSSQIQTLLGRQQSTSCQQFILRLFLDLPKCPTQGDVNTAKAKGLEVFCPPKSQWAPLLPARQAGADSYEVISVRLKASAANDRHAVDEVMQRIRNELNSGLPNDSRAEVRNLGAFAPTQKGCLTTQTDCAGDARFDYTSAGAPLLAAGLMDATSRLLVVLVPIAALVMLLLLLGLFRVRGWYWPLLSAAGAVLLTIGLSLAAGTAMTPAVLAGIPVLVGLGVDYAVQLNARLAEERRKGLGVEAALRVVLSRSGPATLVAAVATMAGLLGLLFITGIDFHFLVAIPLVAEFAGVLIVGVALSWLAALLVSLPAAALVESRRDARRGHPEPIQDIPEPRPARRTIALANAWVAVLAVATVPALAGWLLLPKVPVETDIERLLAHDLPQLTDVNTVRAQVGSANELDLFVEGDVTSNDALAYQLQLARTALCSHRDAVTSGTTLAALLDTGRRSTTATPDPCASPSPGVTGTGAGTGAGASTGAGSGAGASGSSAAAPAASNGASSTPSASPTAMRIRHGEEPLPDVAVLTSVNPAAAAAPAPSPAPTPVASSTPNSSANSAPPAQQYPLQSANVCLLRLFGILSHSLVSGITLPGHNGQGGTQPCPAPSLYGSPNTAISQDPTPVTVDNTRIPLGVSVSSVADQARLVDALTHDVATTPPPSGITGVHPAGLVSQAAAAYNTLTSRALVVNLVPVVVVALVLLLLHRGEPRRGLLPVLPTVLAAGWGPLLVLLMGRLPGNLGATLGALTPLTVVLGALVVALATEFGVVLLERFYEERRKGLDPEEAAAAANAAVGRAVLVSAATLAAGFAVLALTALLPNSLPVVSGFGFTVLVDLGLAVLAVFGVMLPLAVAMERARPLVYATAEGALGLVPLETVDEEPAAAMTPAPKLSKAERRRLRRARARNGEAAAPAAAAVAIPVEALSDEDEPDIELLKEHGEDGRVAAADMEREWESEPEPAAAEMEPAGEREPLLDGAPHREPQPWSDEEPPRTPAGEPVVVPAAAPAAAAAARLRIPGMSARRRPHTEPALPAVADKTAPPDGGTPTRANGIRHMPGISGRRRTPVAGAPPRTDEAAASTPPAAHTFAGMDVHLKKRRRRPPPHMRRRNDGAGPPPGQGG